MQIGSKVRTPEGQVGIIIGVTNGVFNYGDRVATGDKYEVLLINNPKTKLYDEDDLEDITPKTFINVYIADRHYGGPEEGGWWYDVQDLEETYWFPTEAEALAYLPVITQQYDYENKNRNSDIYSVCSEGKYVVQHEAYIGESYPKETPHYE